MSVKQAVFDRVCAIYAVKDRLLNLLFVITKALQTKELFRLYREKACNSSKLQALFA